MVFWSSRLDFVGELCAMVALFIPRRPNSNGAAVSRNVNGRLLELATYLSALYSRSGNRFRYQTRTFAYFPTYRDSPLKPNWSRILAVGDATGIQSPLSFGGFGALTRHLPRLTTVISEALNKDLLHKDDLSLINDYTPNLSVAWMFQKAMSVPRSKNGVDPTFLNNMGEWTLMPFLQDVVRLHNLLGSLSRSFVKDPLFTPQIIQHVGLPVLTNWIVHVIIIAVYTGLHNFVSPIANFLLTLTDATSKREAIL